jgi:hypothetical protein
MQQFSTAMGLLLLWPKLYINGLSVSHYLVCRSLSVTTYKVIALNIILLRFTITVPQLPLLMFEIIAFCNALQCNLLSPLQGPNEEVKECKLSPNHQHGCAYSQTFQ